MRKSELLLFTEKGIYCPIADIYIDPWKPVSRAIITHAHSDHARPGHKKYLAHHHSREILKLRLGNIDIETMEYGKQILINGVKISLHPAGHIIGSSQIRLEYKGEVAVVTGDYKLENDGLTTPFELQTCNTLVIESTFGLPVYKWDNQDQVFNDINHWWGQNQKFGLTSVLCGYALGKAQRLLHNINANIGSVFVHGAIYNVNQTLKRNIPEIKQFPKVIDQQGKEDFRGALIVTPSSSLNSPWMKRFTPYRTAIASGWMAIRGARRRRAVDRGFVLSDHADWPQLNQTVNESQAETVYVTHGYSYEFSRWLNENGIRSFEVKTSFEGELDEINEQTPDISN